jgi:predicted helicase
MDADGWQAITPDQHGDWLAQRDDGFSDYIVLGDKKGGAEKLFDNFSLGVVTNRDAWCYNPSREAVAHNMQSMIDFYNSEVRRFNQAHVGLDKKSRESKVDGFIDANPEKISWTRSLKSELAKDRSFVFEESCLIPCLYRPFTKRWLYFNRRFNEMVYQIPRIFPYAAVENLAICVHGVGVSEGFFRLNMPLTQLPEKQWSQRSMLPTVFVRICRRQRQD